MKVVAPGRARLPGWVRWVWPVPLLIVALLVGPLRARADFPGLPCSASVTGLFEDASYAALFVPVAIVLVLLSLGVRRARAMRRQAASIALVGAAVLLGLAYLVFGNLLWLPAQAEHPISCPTSGGPYQPVRCWSTDPPNPVVEMNATGRRPQNADTLVQLGQSLAAHRTDAFLYQAIILDTDDPAIVDHSTGQLFLLARSSQSPLGGSCVAEAQAKAAEFQAHRVGFYRYSAQQRPPVDAFFLQDTGPNGEVGYEVIDFRHSGEALPYVKPDDLQPVESQYLDRVSASLTILNGDLNLETQTAAPPPGTLATMRRDFDRVTMDLAVNVPPRLKGYQQSRLRRFLQNYDLILAAEESAAQGKSGQLIHASAYEQHRTFYYQEPRVTRLIGYLYLQEPARSFSDDELSTVNWAVF